jgi:AraC-like DNA-binding protein
MRFSSATPTEFLRGFVENFWLYEGYEGEHANERILPTGTIELVINLREDELRIYDADDPTQPSRYSGAAVSGAYGKGFVSDSEEEVFIIGIHFRAGGAFPFLGVPVDELADSHIDLDTLWGHNAKFLREQLAEASTASIRFELLESALVENLRRPLEHHYAVEAALDLMMRSHGDVDMREMAANVGLSQRRFAELFKREVGVAPKLFSRIQRFHRARALIHERARETDWVGIAIDCGYYDQSHLIREFSEFSGLGPSEYLRQYLRFLDDNAHIKRYHFPVSSKGGQFYPIQSASRDDIVNLGGCYVDKE